MSNTTILSEASRLRLCADAAGRRDLVSVLRQSATPLMMRTAADALDAQASRIAELEIDAIRDVALIKATERLAVRIAAERDEARADVRALCGEPEELDPFLPDGWVRGTDAGVTAWWSPDSRLPLVVVLPDVNNDECGCYWEIRNSTFNADDCGYSSSPLTAMRAADKALEASSNH